MKKFFLSAVSSLVFFQSLAVFGSPGKAPPSNSLFCKDKEAEKFLLRGFEFQKDNNSLKAREAYESCLAKDPDCVDCLYEMGWSLWKLGEWKKVVEVWKKALILKPDHDKIPQFLPAAEGNEKLIKGEKGDRIFRTQVDLLKEGQPKEGPLQILMVARWQSYNPKPTSPLDHYDADIDSPKSVVFSPQGDRVYVNSLEGGKTVVLKSSGLEKLAVIPHQFNEKNKSLVDLKAPFDYRFHNAEPWKFRGKPVEATFTHKGKFLWVTYYRRSFDSMGVEPSAVAVIDAEKNEILRVLGTGPISKYISVSPNGQWLAISNWGDNTIGIYDLRKDEVQGFKPLHLLEIEKRLSLKDLHQDRDKDCGFCVRGLEFSSDSRYLIATRMKGGGLAFFDLNKIDQGQKPVSMGTVFGLQPGPRDLHLSPDGKFLFVGCNASGTMVKVELQSLLDLLKDKKSDRVDVNAKTFKFEKKFVGLGLRSFKVSPDGRYIFAAVNNTSEVVVLSATDLSVLSRLPVDSYPVGLSLSPDGTTLWVTSQGKDHLGGNSVAVFQLMDRVKNQVHQVK